MAKRRLLGALLLLPFVVAGVENAVVNSFELPNGLKVLFNPSQNMESTAVCLYYLIGSRNDPPDMPGMSYFFQDLMFGATANLEPYDHVLFVNQKGGIIGGRVRHDNTFFFQVVPSSELAIALRYESERISNLNIDNGAVEAVKRQILARVARVESGVSARARQWVQKTILSGSVYEWPIYGDLERIKGYHPDRVRDFYKNFQNLSNIVLVVCGKLDVDDLKNSVNNSFQNIPGGYRSRSTFTAQPMKERTAVNKNMAWEGVQRPLVVYGFPAPARLSVDYFLFEFLRYYLVGEKISRLDYLLNQVNGLDIEYHGLLTDYFETNVFLIELSAADKIRLEKAKYLFDTEMQSLLTNAISNQEMRMTKNSLELSFLKQMQSLEMRAERIVEFYHMFGGLDFFSSYLNRIRRIDSYDIMNMAKKYLRRQFGVVLNVYGKK